MPHRKNLNLIEVLLKRNGRYMGVGVNHENKEFKGELELTPIVNNKGMLLKYKAVGTTGVEFNNPESLYNVDTVLYNEEHTVIANDNKNHLSLWTLNTSMNTLVKFDLKRYKHTTPKRHLFIFGFGKPEDNKIYREEITIELWENGDLSYHYSWGEPGGHFVSRSTIRMKKTS
jgi:hypothetical protein